MNNDSKPAVGLSRAQRELIAAGVSAVAGLDLGDKHSFLCLLDLDSEVLERKKISTSPRAFERYFSAFPKLRVVFEAGPHANWVHRLLERLQQAPLTVDTRELALITQSLSKDDRTDAAKLAALGLEAPGLLPAVQPRSLETQAGRALLKAREALVTSRTKLINSVRGTVKSFGAAAGGDRRARREDPRLRPRDPAAAPREVSALGAPALAARGGADDGLGLPAQLG